MSRVATFLAAGILAIELPAASISADAKKDFEMLFGAEAKKVAATLSTADDARLAGKLLQSGEALTGSPGLQVLLYEKAYAFGVKNRAGYAAAQRALELLAQAAPGRAREWEAKTFALAETRYKTSTGAARKTDGEAYLKMLVARADAEAAGGDLPEADRL